MCFSEIFEILDRKRKKASARKKLLDYSIELQKAKRTLERELNNLRNKPAEGDLLQLYRNQNKQQALQNMLSHCERALHLINVMLDSGEIDYCLLEELVKIQRTNSKEDFGFGSAFQPDEFKDDGDSFLRDYISEKYQVHSQKPLLENDSPALGMTQTTNEQPEDAQEETPLQKVQFSAVAPKAFVRGEYTMIDLVMYEAAFRHVVDELLAQAEQPVKETRGSVRKVAENAQITVKLTSSDLEIEDNEEEQVWQGDYLTFSFPVMLPEDYAKQQILFTAQVYINGVIATTLKIIASCTGGAQKMEVQRRDVLLAFMSYASEDRQRVAALIQGMKKVRPDMKVFFDVESLHSGEYWEDVLRKEIDRCDTLFLCWSRFASKSKWVDMEWRYALQQKGIDCIEPVPIEAPDLCPPPRELSGKHFNDKMLYIINASGK